MGRRPTGRQRQGRHIPSPNRARHLTDTEKWPNYTKKLVNSRYRTLVSSSDSDYLDRRHVDSLGNDSRYGQPPFADKGKGGSWCGPFKTWQIIYNYDIAYNLTAEESKLVLDREVALWSEQADPQVLDTRIRPRASLVGGVPVVRQRGRRGTHKATDRPIGWRNGKARRGITGRANPASVVQQAPGDVQPLNVLPLLDIIVTCYMQIFMFIFFCDCSLFSAQPSRFGFEARECKQEEGKESDQ